MHNSLDEDMRLKERRRPDPGIETSSGEYLAALLAADGAVAEKIALDCLGRGLSIERLHTGVITPAMHKIGDLWETGEIGVADEHLGTAITHRVIASAYGASFGAADRRGSILLATVESQRHSLGLRMAGDVLELAGFEVIYLGANVPLDALLAAVDSHQPDVIGISSTLSASWPEVERAVSELQTVAEETPIILGGRNVPAGALREGRVIHAPDVNGLVELVERLLPESDEVEGEPSSRRRELPRSAMAEPGAPEEERLLAAVADAADLARSNARMTNAFRRLAHQDPITLGPNRRAFDDRLALQIEATAASPASLLMLDLDGFKQVNDTLGHGAGDDVLREVAEVIQSCLREGDFTARLGGDEFGVLLPSSDVAGAEQVTARILAAVGKAEVETNVTASIGIAPVEGGSRHTMLRADLALYDAKAAGKACYRVAPG